MDYLNYLPDTSYDKLPAAVRATISAQDYAAKRALAAALLINDEQPEALPEVLRTAYLKKQAATEFVEVTSAKAEPVVIVLKYRRILRWMTAACIFFAAIALALLLREPKEQLIYQIVSAETPAPKVIHDTIYQEKILEKVVYLTRTDTIHEYLSGEQTFVYKTDTVYLPQAAEIKFVKSKTAAEEVRLLELLVPTK